LNMKIPLGKCPAGLDQNIVCLVEYHIRLVFIKNSTDS
jgi:hypothetical protein